MNEDSQRETRHLHRLFLGLRILARLRPTERQTLFLWAGGVGFLGASAALLFKAATDGVKWLLTGHHGGYVETFSQLDPWHRLAVPAVGALLAGVILMQARRFLHGKAAEYMEAVALGDGEVPVRGSLIRACGALFSIASGAAIGREGPLVQLAALAASVTGRLRRMSPARRRLLVASGAAAGIAAAYHTPLSGALFVAEVVLGSMAMESLGPLLIASVVSALTVRSFEGVEPLYAYSTFSMGSPREVVLYALLGVVCGLGAAVWMRILKRVKAWFALIPGPLWIRLTLGGIIIGGLAVWRPEVTGNGASVIRSLLADEYSWRVLALLLALKIAATAAAFGSGAVGGVFTPSLFVGSVLGFLFAVLTNTFWAWQPVDAGGFALIGMGAFLAAAAQAPLLAILMLFELTLHYQFMVPLMVAAVTAYFTTRGLGSEAMYAESLRSGPRSVFDLPMASVTVGQLMRPPLHTVAPEARFGDVARTFLHTSAGEVWVTSPDGALEGVIRLSDVRPYLKEPDLAETVIAADIVHEHGSRLARETNLFAALEKFAQSDAEVLAVTDASTGRPVGSVGRADLLLVISELARREGTREA